VAQRLLAYDLFAREDSLNVSHLSKLYFLYSMLRGDRRNPSSFLISQLHGAATSSAQRIVIRDLITPIARFVRIQPTLDDKVPSSEWLNFAAFEQMKFYTVEVVRVCWIYPMNHLMPLPNVDHATLLNQANLYFYQVMKSCCNRYHLLPLLT